MFEVKQKVSTLVSGKIGSSSSRNSIVQTFQKLSSNSQTKWPDFILKNLIKIQPESKHVIQQIYSKQTFKESNYKFLKNQLTSVRVKYYHNSGGCSPVNCFRHTRRKFGDWISEFEFCKHTKINTVTFILCGKGFYFLRLAHCHVQTFSMPIFCSIAFRI